MSFINRQAQKVRILYQNFTLIIFHEYVSERIHAFFNIRLEFNLSYRKSGNVNNIFKTKKKPQDGRRFSTVFLEREKNVVCIFQCATRFGATSTLFL